jgi:citrate lyase beta subunit
MLDNGFYSDLDTRLESADERIARLYPGDRVAARQPVHTVYLPASEELLDVVPRWGAQALSALAEHAGGQDELAEVFGFDIHADVYSRVLAKLDTEPVEDLRIDFEDGYGSPEDAQEEADAEAAAAALAEAIEAGTAAPFMGLRCKGMDPRTRRRGIRTVDVFLGALLERVPLPSGFVVTLPKVVAVEHVAAFAGVMNALELAYGLTAGRLRFEIQVETPQAVLSPDGTVALPTIISAAAGRCVGLHFGTYDYSTALGIPAAAQSLAHPAADLAKGLMQVTVAGTGVRLSDGSTNVLPVGDTGTVRAAWRDHARLVRRSLERGFYQGWDMHPHQLPSRFLATFGYFAGALPVVADRLGTYIGQQEAGTLDEPATAQALASFLLRGLDCGAFPEPDVTARTGLDRGGLLRFAGR